jgi:hypothetical protein
MAVKTKISRGGGKFLREGRTGRTILRLPVSGSNFIHFIRY